MFQVVESSQGGISPLNDLGLLADKGSEWSGSRTEVPNELAIVAGEANVGVP